MTLLENELNQKNVELANNAPEFAGRREYEQKFSITNPEAFAPFREGATTIEQIYLSHPEEEFSLRVRMEESLDGTEYTATLKDNGNVINGVRQRLEIETPISQETFLHYAAVPEFPRIKKSSSLPNRDCSTALSVTGTTTTKQLQR